MSGNVSWNIVAQNNNANNTLANINAVGILAEDIISPFATIGNLTLTVTTLNLSNPINYSNTYGVF